MTFSRSALREVAVEPVGVVALGWSAEATALGLVLRVAEDDRALRVLDLDHRTKAADLVSRPPCTT
jgi:hypothetical protein